MELVSPAIAFKFGDPKFPSIRRRRAIFTPTMTVPKAAMDEDDRLKFRKDNVRATREVFGVNAKTVPHFMKERTDEDFGLRVLAPNAGHVPRPFFLREAIFH